MALLRWLILLLLLSAAASFACFIITGQQRFKRTGLSILRWTLIGTFGFFGVLILEKVV